MAVRSQPDPGGQLFGLAEIGLDQLRETVALQCDDALVALTARGFSGQRHVTGAECGLQVTCFDISGSARHATDRAPVCGLRDKRGQRTVTLQLQDQRTAVLDGPGQQDSRGERLSEVISHDGRVIVALDDRLPTGGERDDLAADAEVFEGEAVELV